MNSPIVSTFAAILMNFSGCFTAPTFETFQTLMQGWVLATGRRTITQVILAANGLSRRSFCVYHRFFSRACWHLDVVGRVLFDLALPLIPPDEPIVVAVDDTLTRKTGKRIWGAAMHHDPLRSTRRRHEFSFGHSWVVLSIQVPIPFTKDRRWALPMLLRLYRKRVKLGRRPKEQRQTGGAGTQEYRTRPELAVEMLETLALWAPGRVIHVVGDSEYGGKSVSRRLPEDFHLTSRMPMNAALFAAPDPVRRGKGRPRKKGERLPSPMGLAQSTKRRWHSMRVSIYGKRVPVRYKTLKALWYNSAGPRLLRIIVVRDPSGKRKDDCFFTTDTSATTATILERVSMRWPLEVTFHDAKQFLGLEDPQNRVAKAVKRTAPMAFYGYSLVVLWFARHGSFNLREYRLRHPWYTRKRTPSFADMLACLRRESMAESFFRDRALDTGSRKSQRPAAKKKRGRRHVA